MRDFKELSRYELKYSLPKHKYSGVIDFISNYCQLDYYSQISDNNFYTVNTIYFDTLNRYFYDLRKNSSKFRFNIRVRSYNDGENIPYFGEIKYKINGFVKKYRVKILSEDILGYLDSPTNMEKFEEPFYYQYYKYLPKPQIFTQYKRIAFFSIFDEYARVTIDKDLKFSLISGDNRLSLKPKDYNLQNYDINDFFLYKSDYVLELKAYKDRVPKWFYALIKKFNLKKSSFSKYVNSMDFSESLLV